MADTKNGREEQARQAENRQRHREITEALERADETEPPVEPAELDDLEEALESLDYPVTGERVVDALGDRDVPSTDGTYTVAETLPATDDETFEEPADVRVRIQRPAIAAALKRIIEASKSVPNEHVGGSQREAYEKTLRELKAIDADDDDEGIEYITDWIVERIREKETLPGSRDVRREAAKFCRRNGYEVRNDDWLGV